MKVLVTGGAGFIGVNFLHALVPRHPEHHFVNLDKLTYAANPRSLEPLAGAPNLGFERVDLVDEAAVREVLARHEPDVIVHFAAESHVDRSIVGPKSFLRSNVEGTFVLLEACRTARHRVQRFHHVSTDEVYGSLGETGSFTEESRYDPSSPYAASKAASDHLVRAWARTYGLPVTITNCSNNYGPYQFPEKLIPLMILNALSDAPLPVYGKGNQVRDWLYVEDHVEAIWAVLTRGREGETYNVGGGAELCNLEVVRRIVAVVAEETHTDQARLEASITHVADRPGHDLRYAIDASKIQRELGWAPRETFDSGLRRTVRWYLEHPDWVRSVQTGDYRAWIEANYDRRADGAPAPGTTEGAPS